jgi:hypothetical protein
MKTNTRSFWRLCLSLTFTFIVAFAYNSRAACISPPSGLVSWWRGESNALDSVDSNNGSLQNGTSFSRGEVDGSFSFDGINDYLLINASSNLDVGKSGGFTIEGWINPESVGTPMAIAEYEKILGGGGNDVGVLFYISIAPPNGTGSGCIVGNVRDTNGVDHVVASAAGLVTTGTWQHVAFSYDKASGMARVYLNGAVMAQATLGSYTPQTSFNLLFGARTAFASAGSPIERFFGRLDELSLYNRSLSTAEISAVYNAGSSGKCAPIPLPPPTNCVSPPAGLVSWWRAESNALDSADGNNGVLSNGVAFTTGEAGQAFVLNGTTAHVRVPASSNLNVGLGVGLTIEGWIKPTIVSALHPLVEWNSGSQDGVHFWIGQFSSDDGVMFANIRDTALTAHAFRSAPKVVSSNVWQHVALTYDKAGGLAVIYVNGTIVAQTNMGSFTPLTSSDLWLGRRPAPNVFYPGMLDEISVYNRALSQSEIQSIYAADGAGKCVPPPPPPPTNCVSPPAGLVSWWRAESNALDVVGINNGVLDGTAGFGPGEVGQAFLFNTTNADVRMPASTSLNLGASNGFTLEAWIYPSNIITKQPLFEWNDGGGGWGVHFYIDPLSFGAGAGALYANVVDSSGGWHQIHSAGGAVASNVLQHVALTYDKSTGVARLYCNGAMVAQQTLGSFTALTTFDFYLGRRVSGAPGDIYTFAGLIDEAAVYGRALSQSEIQSIYAADGAGKCVPAGTVPLTTGSNLLFGPAVDGSDFVVRFAGIPGLTYTVEAAPDLTGPWSKVANIIVPTADAGFGVGVFEFREPIGSYTTRFYRTVFPMY